MNKVGLDLSLAKEALLKGGVVAFPTETVMGLGVVFDNFEAYEKLNNLKGHRENKPYTMMLSSIDDIYKYAYVPKYAEEILKKFMPGPLTILLKSKDSVPTYVTHNTGVVGIRIPEHKELLELLKMVNKPLLVPSANPSGLEPALTVDKVIIYFNDRLDYIIEISSGNGKPSTIVDLTKNEPIIVREGDITLNEIMTNLRRD